MVGENGPELLRMGRTGGHVYPMPSTASGMPENFVQQVVNVTVVNSIDPSDLFKAGLAANGDAVVNVVAGNVRNGGVMRKTQERYGK